MRWRAQSARRVAVVARRAAGLDTGVIEECAGIAHCVLMASLAWRVRHHMICRLADRDCAVVTCGAGGRNAGMVHANAAPIARDVALLAEVRCPGVLIDLALGGRAVMTRGTLPRCPSEATSDVARCAINSDMGSGQRIPGREVVERGRLRVADRRRAHGDAHGHDERTKQPFSKPHSVPTPISHLRGPTCLLVNLCSLS